MRLAFHTLDVFTERRFAGNPLAVVHGADDLDDHAMQSIAREFNLSETVFVCAPRDPVNTASIRIFTPRYELPFAGHPTVGAAVLLARLRAPEQLRGGVTIALEEKIGLVSVDVSERAGRATRGVFGLPKLSEQAPGHIDPRKAALALGLQVDEIGFDRHAPGVWSAGVPYALVPVTSAAALSRAALVDPAAARAAFEEAGALAVYLYTRDAREPGHAVAARMFVVGQGGYEDPATGSAVAAFAGAAVAFEQPEDGLHQLVVEQGYDMGRPSEIVLDLDVSAGALVGARIGGAAVIASEGILHVSDELG